MRSGRPLLLGSVVAVVTLFATLGGIAPRGDEALAASEEKGRPLKVRFGWQKAGSGPVFLTAMRLGLFEQAGLQVELHHFVFGREALAALRGKDIDVSIMSHVPLVIGAAQGIPLVAIDLEMDVSKNEMLLVHRDGPIDSVQRLKGKRIGFTRGTSAHWALGLMLEKAGLSWSDVVSTPLGPDHAVTAFRKREIDAVIIWAPWSLVLAEEGGKVLQTDADIGVSLFVPWVARTEWVRENPEAARRLMIAADLARKQLEREPAVAIKEHAAGLNLSMDLAGLMFKRERILSIREQLDPSSPSNIVNPNGAARTFNATGAFLRSLDAIPREIDGMKLVEPGPMKALDSSTSR